MGKRRKERLGWGDILERKRASNGGWLMVLNATEC